jgi:hypothetical protein
VLHSRVLHALVDLQSYKYAVIFGSLSVQILVCIRKLAKEKRILIRKPDFLGQQFCNSALPDLFTHDKLLLQYCNIYGITYTTLGTLRPKSPATLELCHKGQEVWPIRLLCYLLRIFLPIFEDQTNKISRKFLKR